MSQERRPPSVELEQLRAWVGTIQRPPPALCLSAECKAALEAMPQRSEERRPPPSPPRRRRPRRWGWLLVVLLGLLVGVQVEEPLEQPRQ